MNKLTRDQFVKAIQDAEKDAEPFLKKFENTSSVSDSSQESGVSHAVRDRNANGQAAEKESESNVVDKNSCE